MRRLSIPVRNKWQSKVESLGFGFHTTNIPYWDESACYEFSMQEVLMIEQKTTELWQMFLDAVQYIIDHQLYAKFGIPDFMIPLIEKSWNEDHPAIYNRFDFSYNNGQLKLLEFNADTPTSLFEMAVVQWHWLQDYDASRDQFNSAHEKLVAYWGYLKEYLNKGPLHFSCVKRSLEDLTTTEYLRDCAMQAGLDTNLVFIDDIGWNGQEFLDLEERPIQNIFKLYPWEWMARESFGQNLSRDEQRALWIEPAWKMLLSNKAILPIMYDLYRGNDLILPAFFEPPTDGSDYVKKPILGREGANIEIVKGGRTAVSTGGDYGSEGYVYQGLAELPNFDGKYPLIGSWIIGQEAAGMGIREADTLITNNTSRFVPHYIR
jgi:glutathionylspermidine synthase